MYYARPNNRWAQTAQPAFEPLTLAEAKQHLRVEVADDDALITSLVIAARQYIEGRTGRILCSRAHINELAGFPRDGKDIVLPVSPVTAVASVSYFDSNGATQTLTVGTGYRLALHLSPARIRLPVSSSAWLETIAVEDAVTITFTAGYANIGAVPETAKHAVRLLIGHWYENREAVVTGTIASSLLLTVDSLCGILHSGEVMP